MTTILVALDGSDHSRRALALAIDLAKLQHADLTLLHVEDDRPVAEGDRHLMAVEFNQQLKRYSSLLPAYAEGGYLPIVAEGPPVPPDATLRAAMEEAILEDAAREARRAGVAARKLARQGDAGKQIVSAAEEVGAELIVMGRRGLNTLEELLLGSVSRKVLRESRRNVLTVV
ncbi:universal stress protein [Devosia nitrariae]|uniref:Universal stress protein A n=1 Tax=Devosia nitrariae TaxID=2071872 RepID=A0ABQ5WA59_9HYPH|nr:universal stress protein [Devosia nitrariae]GLQ56654.1 universal stress protein A [Devosia nitrariae]